LALPFPSRQSRGNVGDVDDAPASKAPNTPIADFVERRLRSLFGSTSYQRLGERVDVAKNQKRTTRFERTASSLEWPEKDCVE
jgi:hypothetical protein